MISRVISPASLPEIISWYKDQGFDDMPAEILPARGVLVEGLACAWLYESDSALGWIGFPVINPEAPKHSTFKALDLVFDEIIRISETLDMKIIFTSFGHESLKRLALLKNFVEGDTNVSNFWRYA